VGDYLAVRDRRAHRCPRPSRWPLPLAERPDHLDTALGLWGDAASHVLAATWLVATPFLLLFRSPRWPPPIARAWPS
jgi:hypothetical protein